VHNERNTMLELCSERFAVIWTGSNFLSLRYLQLDSPSSYGVQRGEIVALSLEAAAEIFWEFYSDMDDILYNQI